MNPIELSDRDGDALTLTTHAHGVWITCTSGHSEVTVGPILPDVLHAAFAEHGGPDPDLDPDLDHGLDHGLDPEERAVDPAMGAPSPPH